jgi:hypothetical protein
VIRTAERIRVMMMSFNDIAKARNGTTLWIINDFSQQTSFVV